VSPGDPTTFSKFGQELADALEAVASDPELIGNPEAALEVLGITLPPGVSSTVALDAEGLLRAAEAIRAEAIPAFWPWIWYIPWIGFAPPEGG